MVKMVLTILGKPEGLIEFVKDRLGHDFRYSLNVQKINEQIGWKSTTKFEEGIEKTLQWYLNHKEWVNSKTQKK